jgi:hypothetical protein
MKYLRRTTGYALLDHDRNEEIVKELHITPLEGKNVWVQTQLVPTPS